MKNIGLLLIAFILFTACQATDSKATKTPPPVPKKEEVLAPKEKPTQKIEIKESPKNEYIKKTASGKVFNIKQEHTKGVYQYTISGEGFRSPQTLTTTGRGQMKEVLQADLDGNGFEEIYIISADKGAPTITAFSSYRDKSFGEINVPAVPKKLLSGYKGEDKIYLQDGKLMRSFPIFKGDIATGETRTIQYKLVQGEASFQLEATLIK